MSNARPSPARFLVPALGALLALACGGSAPTDPTGEPAAAANRGQPGQELPFRMSGGAVLLGQEFAPGFGPPTFQRSDFDGRCSVPSDFVIRFSLEGRATHLGNVTATAEHCTRIDFQTGLSSWRDGVLIFTAADGDQLWDSYESAGSFPPPDPDVPSRELHEFTGGTGRFVGASGEGMSHVACDTSAGTCVFEMEGVIVYDASADSD